MKEELENLPFEITENGNPIALVISHADFVGGGEPSHVDEETYHEPLYH